MSRPILHLLDVVLLCRAMPSQSADLPLGGVDASVVALAERLGTTEIATLDRRHFKVVRPRHADAFTLVPATEIS